MSEWDVVVVGAGPAGSVAAACLARTGVSVLLVDRVRLPRWKVCGACIGPAALGLLESLGLGGSLGARGAVPLDRMELRVSTRRARIRLRGNVALSRTALDELLAEAAVRAGVSVRYDVRVEAVSTGDRRDPSDRGHRRDGEGRGRGRRRSHRGVDLHVRSRGESGVIRAHAVIDATGLGAGLGTGRAGSARHDDALVARRSRIGVGAVFGATGDDVPPGELRMAVGRSGYVGLVRVEGGLVNVAAAVDRDALSSYGPAGAVASILESAGIAPPRGETVEGWRGTPALTRRPCRVAHDRVFRVGDAAGYAEPFTGEGIGWAISSAVAVVPFVRDAVARRDPGLADGWVRTYRRRIARRRRLCRLLARGLRRPRLVRAVVGILAVAPRLAEPFVRATGRVPESGVVEGAAFG